MSEFVLEFSFRITNRVTGRSIVISNTLISGLERIRELGSIVRACRVMNKSYRWLWGTIARLESVYGMKLVKKVRGGETGGGTTLTDFGAKFLEEIGEYLLSLGGMRQPLSLFGLMGDEDSDI